MDDNESPEIIKKKINMLKRNEEKEISYGLQKVNDRQFHAMVKFTENNDTKSRSAKYSLSKTDKVQSNKEIIDENN